jgi:hypothetical protein
MSQVFSIPPFHNSIIIKNLYYDIIEKQFIINSNEITDDIIKKFSWYGRDNPIFLGKNIISKTITEMVETITIGENESQTIFLARRYSPHNFGHLLCETAIPIEYNFNLLNINEKDKRIIIFDDSSWDGFDNITENTIHWFEGNDVIKRTCCDNFSNNLFYPMAQHVIYDFKNYITNIYIEKSRYIKINNNVIFGIGNISPWIRYWENDIRITYAIDSLNHKIYNTNNIQTIPIQNTITFIIKIGRRQVLNWEEVGDFLKYYATKNNLRYEQFNLDDITFQKQLEVLSRTRILVTNGGSSSFSSLFLQKNTNLIYFPILGNTLETIIFKHINRCKLSIYEDYDTHWKNNIKTEDGSFVVNITILHNILQIINPRIENLV